MILPFETHYIQTKLSVSEIHEKLSRSFVTSDGIWNWPHKSPNWMTGNFDKEDEFVGDLSADRFKIQRFISSKSSTAVAWGEIQEKGDYRLIIIKMRGGISIRILAFFLIVWCSLLSILAKSFLPFVLMIPIMLFFLLPFNYQAKRYLKELERLINVKEE